MEGRPPALCSLYSHHPPGGSGPNAVAIKSTITKTASSPPNTEPFSNLHLNVQLTQ